MLQELDKRPGRHDLSALRAIVDRRQRGAAVDDRRAIKERHHAPDRPRVGHDRD